MPPAYISQRHYKLSSSRYINANSLFTHYLVYRGRGKGLGRKVDTAVRSSQTQAITVMPDTFPQSALIIDVRGGAVSLREVGDLNSTDGNLGRRSGISRMLE